MAHRELIAWFSYPVLMGGFLALAGWGLGQGYDPGTWGAALAVIHFFVLLGAEQALPRHPQMSVFKDRQSLNDIGHGILLASVARPVGSALSILVMAQLAGLRNATTLGGVWPSDAAFAVQLGLGLLIWTFSDYWIHRALHSFDRLWWFHAIHHDTPQMHILKSGRIHAGEEIFNAILKPIPLLAMGVPPEILVWIGLWIVFDGNLAHCNVHQRFPSWFHYVVGTVHLHNLHHAVDRRLQDSNYSGSTPIWDLLFRTFNHPDRCELGEMGLERSPVPPGLLAQLAFPFRAQPATPRSAASPPTR